MPDQLIPITRPTVNNPVPPVAPLESKFPTEVINLPSKGWFYSPESVLSNGNIELKMMTAKEEDILTSRNLIQKNIVLDKLLEAIVIDKSIKIDEMLVCDRNAVFYAMRRLAYGDQYDVKISCGRCAKENETSIDLSKMDNRPFEFEKYPKGENNFTFILPHSGVTVGFKLLTKKDETAIDQELVGLAKVYKDVSKEVTTRLAHLIISVDGNSEKTRIRKFVNEELLSKDSLALRTHYRDNMPDIDTTFPFTCTECGLERKEETPMGASFFWPNR